MASSRIQHRINFQLKQKAEKILLEQGIKPSWAIAIFYSEITRTGGFPFLPSKVPNKQLDNDLEEAKKGKGIKTYKSKKDLFNSLENF